MFLSCGLRVFQFSFQRVCHMAEPYILPHEVFAYIYIYIYLYIHIDGLIRMEIRGYSNFQSQLLNKKSEKKLKNRSGKKIL